MDFCEIFPPELSSKLFSYVSDRDLYSCGSVCVLWREIINNDSQWRLRCFRRGWCSSPSNSDIKVLQHWNEKKSHVAPHETYRFRTSPVFSPSSSCVSQNLSPLCEWAAYFRKRSHLSRNWHKGIYKITKLQFPAGGDAFSYHLINDSCCDGTLLAAGTHRGYVLIWQVEGVPKFITSIPPHHRRLEVETVKILDSKYLVVLYQTASVNVFTISKDEKTANVTIQPFYQIKVVGADYSDEDGYGFECQQEHISHDLLFNDNLETDDPNSELRYLFHPQLRRTHQLLEDIGILLFSSESHIILTGFPCKCFIAWNILSHSPKKLSLHPQGFCVSQKGHISSRKVYFPLYQYSRTAGVREFCISIYDLNSLTHVPDALPEITIPCSSEVEEIHSDSQDKRIVYSTANSRLHGMNVITKEVLFCNEIPHSIDYMVVSDEIIVYEDSNGMHVGLNWAGDPLYIIEGDFGKVIGLRTVADNILVSGGTSRQLSVWDLKSGEKLHTVYHQPCMINYLYADDTKIVTIGKEDEPVVVGYW